MRNLVLALGLGFGLVCSSAFGTCPPAQLDSPKDSGEDAPPVFNAIAARGKLDLAIRFALENVWQARFGRGQDTSVLVDLLRRRYSAAELKRAWDDAELFIANTPGVLTLELFGVALPLPGRLRDNTPAGEHARDLSDAERLGMLRSSDLQAALFGSWCPRLG